MEPVHCSMYSSNCCFLTCTQISQEAGQVIWYSHLLKNFPVCCDPHSQRFWHSQLSRNRCFSGALLLFRWSNRCWHSTSCEMLGWIKHKLKSRLLGEISKTSDMQMTPPLWQKVKENWRASWKWKSEKVGLKLNIQKTKIMASSPITSWQIDGETVTDLIFWAPKSLQMVTAAMKLKDTCSLEEKLWPTWTAY